MELTSEKRDILMRCDKNIECFSLYGLEVGAKIVDVYDGDTVKACFYYNGRIWKFNCRCMGYDCPEMRPPKDDPNRNQQIVWANMAKSALISILKPHTRLVKLKIGEFGSLGRLLVTIYVDDLDISGNQYMIDNGYGKPYNGFKREKFTSYNPKKFH